MNEARTEGPRRAAPRSEEVSGSGLRLRVHVWDADGEPPPGAPRTLLLLHGYLDCGGTFGPLARALPRWLRVLAPDMRGHGGSDRVDHGSWYHFHDYVRDVRAVVDALGEGPLAVLGHSMGGGISVLFAGTWPEDVARLVLVEGLGPPADPLDQGPARMARWVRELRAGPEPSRAFPSLAAVASRLQRQNPGLVDAHAAELAGHLAEPVEGGVRWRHDPWHRARSAQLYRPELYAPFLAAIQCPTLTVTGGRSWYTWADLDDRRAHLRDRRHAHFEDVGHMVHYEVPEALAELVAGHLTAAPGAIPGGETQQ
jgi:pimeloyl-ACP methyl ester carboxylesterase